MRILGAYESPEARFSEALRSFHDVEFNSRAVQSAFADATFACTLFEPLAVHALWLGVKDFRKPFAGLA